MTPEAEATRQACIRARLEETAAAQREAFAPEYVRYGIRYAGLLSYAELYGFQEMRADEDD